MRGRERLWPLHNPTEGKIGEGGGRQLVYNSSEWVEELQLLVSEGSSLGAQLGNDGTSSACGGCRGGVGEGKGGGGGGTGRHGWKPLHLGTPFVSWAVGSNAFRVSTLSSDFVLQRFFYTQKRAQHRKDYFQNKSKESKVKSTNAGPYKPLFCSTLMAHTVGEGRENLTGNDTIGDLESGIFTQGTPTLCIYNSPQC